VISGEGKRVKKITLISKKQLKKKESPTYEMPKELKRAYNKVISALKKGDRRVLDSLGNIPDQIVVVKKHDLNSRRIQEKALKLRQIPLKEQKEFISEKSSKNAYREAANTFKKNASRNFQGDYYHKIESYYKNYITSSLKKDKKPISDKGESLKTQKLPVDSKIKKSRPRVTSPEKETAIHTKGKSASMVSKTSRPKPSMRFRDWNPDTGVARRMGVSIKYFSRNNEIRCPELRLSSKNVSSSGYSSRGRGGFSSSGGDSSSRSRMSSSSGSSSGSSRSTGSSGSKSSGGSRSSGSSSRGGSRGSVKKN